MRKYGLFLYRRFLPSLLAVLIFAGCLPVLAEGSALSVTFEAVEDSEFGAVHIGCTIEEFCAAGFTPGDSCDVELSNGFRLEDVPVYDGYNTLTGEPLIVLYPGYPHPAFTYATTGNMWGYAGVQAGDTVTVTLREKGKYIDVQQSLSAVYSNDRNAYPSDIVFSNFRELSGGKLRPRMFYRGASPVDDRNLRAACTDGLIREAGIGFILDLADTQQKAAAYPFFPGSRFEELMANGSVACLGLTAAYREPAYASSLAEGLRAMMSQDQPVYIHCTEGKDRTGFVCILLEALAGADYEELLRDYMVTYDNYYGINEVDTPEKYAATVRVRFRDMMDWLAGVPSGTDLSGQTFEAQAAAYLMQAGMTEEEVLTLIFFLTGEQPAGL